MNKISFVWAEDEAGWIGKKGQLPWHLPVDLRHFKQVTMHHPVVMGANTFRSIGRSLPGRDNIIVTHKELNDQRVMVVNSIEKLQQLLSQHYQDQEICIIGGAGLFRQTLSLVNVLHRTVIEGDHDGDVKMIPINYAHWHLVNQKAVPATEPHTPNCYFEDWVLNEKERRKIDKSGTDQHKDMPN